MQWDQIAQSAGLGAVGLRNVDCYSSAPGAADSKLAGGPKGGG
jgi:hypothetical protein